MSFVWIPVLLIVGVIFAFILQKKRDIDMAQQEAKNKVIREAYRAKMGKPPYPCACCGYKTLDNLPGEYDVCSICGWESDPMQEDNPDYEGGANGSSLRQYQKLFLKKSIKQKVYKGFKKDLKWTPLPQTKPN